VALLDKLNAATGNDAPNYAKPDISPRQGCCARHRRDQINVSARSLRQGAISLTH